MLSSVVGVGFPVSKRRYAAEPNLALGLGIPQPNFALGNEPNLASGNEDP